MKSQNGTTLRVARNQDMIRLPWLLVNRPETLIVQGPTCRLNVTQLIQKPYMLLVMEEFFVLYGKSPLDRTLARFRVVNVDRRNVLQYTNSYYPKWGDWTVKAQLLIPLSKEFDEQGVATK